MPKRTWQLPRRITRIGLQLLAAAVVLLAASTAAAQVGADPERGGELYQQYCSMCHGTDGLGRVGASLNSFPGISPEASVVTTTKQGVPGSVMPAWGQVFGGPLSDADIDDIAAYILGILGGTQPAYPAPTYVPPEIPPLPEVGGDPELGATLFRGDCAVCHGEDAQGGFGWPLAKSWPGERPEVYLQQVIGAGITGTVMPAWSETHGGPYSQEQLANVSAYILSLSPMPVPTSPAPTTEGPLDRTISLVLIGVVLVLGVGVLIRYYRRV